MCALSYLWKPEWGIGERNEENDGNAGNQGGIARNRSGNNGNQGGNAGNAGNQGGNDENTENQGGNTRNAGNQGENAGNAGDQGGNEGNKGKNLLIGVQLINYNCGEEQKWKEICEKYSFDSLVREIIKETNLNTVFCFNKYYFILINWKENMLNINVFFVIE